MTQTAEECLQFLENARATVEDLSIVIDREKQLEQDENRLEKALEAEKKLVADAIQQTIKKRREEINTSYDREITRAQEQMKKTRTQREKAKSQGVKERIAEETSELHAHNQELEARMKTTFRKSHVPAFCRTRLYYSLYFPRWAKELLVLLLYVLLVFLALPYGLYLLIPERRPLFLAGIYLADILVFGGIYMSVGNHTKVQYMEALREGRQILDQMHANRKKIQVITSTIRKDRNESLYNLEKYDDEIARMQQELSDVAAKKKDALSTFESVTKTILQDEIEHNHKEKLDQLQNEYDGVREQLKSTSSELKEKRLHLTDQYETHLGTEFLDAFKIQDLIRLIRGGQAANITEAIEQYQKQHV
ncbi:MAG: hypothetical protein PHV18_14065 [Lachnospiraceae bacterium]|nr:hypothetical protein [Lachnospiraceae bacterium]